MFEIFVGFRRIINTLYSLDYILISRLIDLISTQRELRIIGKVAYVDHGGPYTVIK